MTTDNPQGLEPSTVWTREYVRTELWANVHGDLAEDCETVVDVG